jgi:hypothetical protein
VGQLKNVLSLRYASLLLWPLQKRLFIFVNVLQNKVVNDGLSQLDRLRVVFIFLPHRVRVLFDEGLLCKYILSLNVLLWVIRSKTNFTVVLNFIELYQVVVIAFGAEVHWVRLVSVGSHDELSLNRLYAKFDWDGLLSSGIFKFIYVFCVLRYRILFLNFMDSFGFGVGVDLVFFITLVEVILRVVVFSKVQLIVQVVLWHQREHAPDALLALLGSDYV